jgi:hypothetical protein
MLHHGPHDIPRKDQDVTALISRLSIIAFCLVVSASTSTNAETASAIDKASGDSSFIALGDSSFIIAQTSGMERRQGRRANRQECRHKEGIVGKDKRECKQEGRQKKTKEKDKKAQPAPG